MDASPIITNGARPLAGGLAAAGRAQFGQGSASALSMKWSALHDAATIVGALAGIPGETMRSDVRSFPLVMREAGGWRRDAAEQGIEDLAAVMEPGLSALLAAHARGASPAAPALALWQEFLAARDALLTLAPPAGRSGPMRSA
jgi:hypothetical protein